MDAAARVRECQAEAEQPFYSAGLARLCEQLKENGQLSPETLADLREADARARQMDEAAGIDAGEATGLDRLVALRVAATETKRLGEQAQATQHRRAAEALRGLVARRRAEASGAPLLSRVVARPRLRARGCSGRPRGGRTRRSTRAARAGPGGEPPRPDGDDEPPPRDPTLLHADVEAYASRLDARQGAERTFVVAEVAYLGHPPSDVDAALDRLADVGKLRLGSGEGGIAIVLPAWAAARRREAQRQAVRRSLERAAAA